jgi:transcription termination factor Rho
MGAVVDHLEARITGRSPDPWDQSRVANEGEGSFVSETTTRPVSGLSAMKLDELKGVASSMGIKGTAKMRKSDLVEAIRARQSGGTSPMSSAASASTPGPAPTEAPSVEAGPETGSETGAGSGRAPAARTSRRATRPTGAATTADSPATAETTSAATTEPAREPAEAPAEQGRREPAERGDRRERGDREERAERAVREARESGRGGRDERGDRQNERQRDRQGDRQNERQGDRQNERQNERQQGDQGGDRPGNQQNHATQNRAQQNQQNQQGQQARLDDDDRSGGRRSRNRQRNRDRKRGRGRDGGQDWNESDLQVNDDDVLVPVAGILDVLDNYAFVRTTGYLAGPNDVYVPLGMVKKHGLRKGDAVTGAVKALREGEQPQGNVGRQKYNALVRLDSVNGASPDEADKRVEFGKLTPLYPQQRLRLETEPGQLTTRVIDLVAPIGKGQRGLIVAPAKAGKTMVMQSLANAITTNNPECHLMVVLVDERPEEVTDMQRAVKGEVIASTFDRPAEDHTTVAELAIERAKRLVELGHDVVVLLDSITKLGRAYNLAAPASGRILSGGVDSAALYPPKKFFGAARNIENGGSLTILATALVETGSKMDEVIFEEFKGTGNMELKLDRQLANRRIFPAVDINASGTRREEILLASEELKIMWKLRRVLGGLDAQQAIELLIDRLRKTKTNYEFLMQVQATSSNRLDDLG